MLSQKMSCLGLVHPIDYIQQLRYNMLGVTTPDMLDIELLRRFSRKYRLRVGVGIAVRARDAIRKATEALDCLRRSDIIAVSIVT